MKNVVWLGSLQSWQDHARSSTCEIPEAFPVIQHRAQDTLDASTRRTSHCVATHLAASISFHLETKRRKPAQGMEHEIHYRLRYSDSNKDARIRNRETNLVGP